MTEENGKRLDEILGAFRAKRAAKQSEQKATDEADVEFHDEFKRFCSQVLQPTVETINQRIAEVGLSLRHSPSLGSFRHPTKSANGNPSFRLYAYDTLLAEGEFFAEQKVVSAKGSITFEAVVPEKLFALDGK